MKFNEWRKLRENDNAADFGEKTAPEPNEDSWAQQAYDGQAEIGDTLNQVSQALGNQYPSLMQAAKSDPNIADELNQLLQGQSQGGPPPEDMGEEPDVGTPDMGDPF